MVASIQGQWAAGVGQRSEEAHWGAGVRRCPQRCPSQAGETGHSVHPSKWMCPSEEASISLFPTAHH